MKQTIRVGVAIASLAVLATSALAQQGILGSWRGHIKIDASKLPPESDSAKLAKRNAAIQKHEHQTPVLVFKADHTYFLSIPGDKKAPTQSGTWKQSGATIVIQAIKDGKAAGPTQTFMVSKDGKSFGWTTPRSVATFTR